MKTLVQSVAIAALLAAGYILSPGQRDLDLLKKENMGIPHKSLTKNTSSPGLEVKDPSVVLSTGNHSSLSLVVGAVRGGARSNSSHRLKVIPPPPEGSRIVFVQEGSGLIFQGNSTLALLCGKCAATLAAGVANRQLPNIVLYCNHCGSFNDTEDCADFGDE